MTDDILRRGEECVLLVDGRLMRCVVRSVEMLTSVQGIDVSTFNERAFLYRPAETELRVSYYVLGESEFRPEERRVVTEMLERSRGIALGGLE